MIPPPPAPSMHPVSRLVLVGPMGAGKSCVGHLLAAHYGLAFVDADEELQRRSGASIAQLFEREGEAGFRLRERELLAELLARDALVLATGGGAVLDAGTRARLRERGGVVHLHADVHTQLARLMHDTTRPLLARDDREAVLHRLATERAPLYAEVADVAIDTRGLDARGVADAVIARLAQHRPHQEVRP